MKARAITRLSASAMAPALVVCFACGSSTPSAEALPESSPAHSPAKEANVSGATEEWSAAEPDGTEAAPSESPTPANAGRVETRTTEAIAKIVKDHRKGARACYEQVLRDIPNLRGDVVVTFVLRPDGSMKQAELNEQRSTLKEPKLTNCIIEVLTHLEFPASSRGMETKVNYPFNFVP